MARFRIVDNLWRKHVVEGDYLAGNSAAGFVTVINRDEPNIILRACNESEADQRDHRG